MYSNKKLDLFEYDQKSGIKVRKYGHIWGSLFPVSWNETEKKVTLLDSQNYHSTHGFQKIRPILIVKLEVLGDKGCSQRCSQDFRQRP